MVRGKLVFAREWCDSPNGKICISSNLPKKATESTKVNGQRRWPYVCMETTQNLDGSRKATTGRKKIDGDYPLADTDTLASAKNETKMYLELQM